MALAEAQSKCEHIAGVPLQPEIQKYLHTVYLAKGVHATTAIEGNTLSEDQVRKHIDGKLSLPPSQEYLGKEIDNIVKACTGIKNQIMQGAPTDLSIDEIKKFNLMVFEGQELDTDITPGEIRHHSVGVGRYRGAPAKDCEYLLDRLCKWLNNGNFNQQDRIIATGIIRAIISHIYIAWIHPFGDGNGRTARLVEFKILLAHGVPSAAAHLLTNHYNQTRTNYYQQLEYASGSGGDILPFIEYAVNGFIDGLKEQLEVVRGQQLRITWRDFVYDNFRNKSGVTNERRRKLVIDISEQHKPVSLKEMRHVSPRIAELYAKKTDRAISRDINHLVEIEELLVRKNGGYEPNWERMLAFLPERRLEK
jgi:Fic family protein